MGTCMNKVCDKCGCTEFVLGTFCIDIGGLPFIDSVYYCKECGEIYKEDRKHYKNLNTEVNNENCNK